MTRSEAKRELWPMKEMGKSVKVLELEIERLMTVATKMTTNYVPVNISGAPRNKIEDAIIETEKYRTRLANKQLELVQHKNYCMNKVERIGDEELRNVLSLYFFQNKTLEQTAELIGRTYQWTHELYDRALDEYAKIP